MDIDRRRWWSRCGGDRRVDRAVYQGGDDRCAFCRRCALMVDRWSAYRIRDQFALVAGQPLARVQWVAGRYGRRPGGRPVLLDAGESHRRREFTGDRDGAGWAGDYELHMTRADTQ